MRRQRRSLAGAGTAVGAAGSAGGASSQIRAHILEPRGRGSLANSTNGLAKLGTFIVQPIQIQHADPDRVSIGPRLARSAHESADEITALDYGREPRHHS